MITITVAVPEELMSLLRLLRPSGAQASSVADLDLAHGWVHGAAIQSVLGGIGDEQTAEAVLACYLTANNLPPADARFIRLVRTPPAPGSQTVQ